MVGIWSDRKDTYVEGHYVRLHWHPLFPLLAGALTDGTVEILNDNAQRLEYVNIKEASPTTWVLWHPAKKMLAVAWENGNVATWSDTERTCREGKLHHSTVTMMKWNPNGSRLITGDEDGKVVVWKVDSRGRIHSSCQYQFKTPMNFCVFYTPEAVRNQEVDVTTFYMSGLNTGIVYRANDNGQCTEELSIPDKVLSIVALDKAEHVLLISDTFQLYRYTNTGEGKLQMQNQVKLSTTSSAAKKTMFASWAGSGALALNFGDALIRLWDLNEDDIETLKIPHLPNNVEPEVTCMDYNVYRNILAVGTSAGIIYMWKFVFIIRKGKQQRDLKYELLPEINVSQPIEAIGWGCTDGLLYVKHHSSMKILSEQIIKFALHGTTCAVQLSAHRVIIEHGEQTSTLEWVNSYRIKEIRLSNNVLAIWNGKTVEVYEFSDDSPVINPVASIPTDATMVAIHPFPSLILGSTSKIDICSLQGIIKHSLYFSEDSDGALIHMNVVNDFLVAVTGRNHLKIYDFGKKETRLHCSKKLNDYVKMGQVAWIACNCNGTFAAFLATSLNKDHSYESWIDSKIYLYDVDRDSITFYDLANNGFSPVKVFWDTIDPRVMVCEADKIHSTSNLNLSQKQKEGKGTFNADGGHPDNEEPDDTGSTPVGVVSLVVSTDYGIVVQDIFHKQRDIGYLVGVTTPFMYFTKRIDFSSSLSNTPILKKPFRDFVGFKSTDPKTLQVMLDFSFFLTVGNMDEAFKSVQLIQNNVVWENMAKMCVKTKRLDVALVCLGKMGMSGAARSVRNAMKEKEPNVGVAALAIQLGCYDDVEALYTSCERYDLLAKFYQDTDQWQKALELTGSKDRINLRKTYHHFGNYLEEIGDITGAIVAYEKSGTYNFDVPRMLIKHQEELQKYVDGSSDKSLKKWLSKYAECQGDYNVALKYAELSQDYLSVVKINCYCGNMTQAISVAEKCGQQAAFYHLAREYESQGAIKEAISFYSEAKCLAHALRLAKEHHLDDELMTLALRSNEAMMLDVARYYETNEDYQKAINLYYKSHNMGKAIELCFLSGQFTLLNDIANDLGEGTNTEILQKCAHYFEGRGDIERAVKLLITAKKIDEALKICLEHQVTVTQDMADKMSNVYTTGEAQDSEQAVMIRKIADVCMKQRSYHLACKKYTQAGDRVLAMKALLCSGDTEKIIFFAGVSGPKHKEIYVIAANYLQTLDWRNKPEIMKNIITFYIKAKAYDSLCGFFEACSQVEIDEYQNYEKGLSALKEALKCIKKATPDSASSPTMTASVSSKIASLERRIDIMTKFVQAKTLLRSNPEDLFKLCHQIMNDDEVEHAIRAGDIYALMIESCYRNGLIDQAVDLYHIMKGKVGSDHVDYYLDKSIVKVLDPNYIPGATPEVPASDNAQKTIHEDIDEEII